MQKHNKIYPATNDVVFKKIFGDINNKKVIKGFLSSILDIPEEEYELLKIENPFLNIADSTDDKIGILDVKISTKNKKIIDIEIQVARMKYMCERILCYLSKMTLEQIGSGEDYGKIQKVVSIVIAADHILIKDSKSQHNRYVLYDKKSGSTFTDKMEVNTLDLMKKPDPKTSDPNITKWVEFFNAKTEEELKMVNEMPDVAVKQAAQIVLKVNQDEDLRVRAEQRENAVRAYNSEMLASKQEGMKIGIARGRAEGMEEGINKGRAEGAEAEKIELAKNALKNGLDVEMVSNITKLPIDEINKIKNVYITRPISEDLK